MPCVLQGRCQRQTGVHEKPELENIDHFMGRINPDFAFKKSKKTDPFKSFISQPPEPRKLAFLNGCEIKDFNGPIKPGFCN